MKNLIRVLLLATLFLFIAGNLKAQFISLNGEFRANYLDGNTILTHLGDTIHLGDKVVDGINDEGHMYTLVPYENVVIPMYYSSPWDAENVLFVEYNRDGTLYQSLLLKDGTYCYYREYGVQEVGFINNLNYLKLWQ